MNDWLLFCHSLSHFVYARGLVTTMDTYREKILRCIKLRMGTYQFWWAPARYQVYGNDLFLFVSLSKLWFLRRRKKNEIAQRDLLEWGKERKRGTERKQKSKNNVKFMSTAIFIATKYSSWEEFWLGCHPRQNADYRIWMVEYSETLCSGNR